MPKRKTNPSTRLTPREVKRVPWKFTSRSPKRLSTKSPVQITVQKFFRLRGRSKICSFTKVTGVSYGNEFRDYCPLTHLVLHDAKGNGRFALAYGGPNVSASRLYGFPFSGKSGLRWRYNDFVIHLIQRLNTSSAKDQIKTRVLETKAAKAFRGQLGKIHPSDFLLMEFLYRNRKTIREGLLQGHAGLWLFGKELNVSRSAKPNYLAIISKFFDPKPVVIESGAYKSPSYRLNPRKKRVQELLGIRVDKEGKVVSVE